MSYYKRLKDLRKDSDLKQKDIAEIIQTSANYYGDYEQGKRDLPLERAVILAKYYNVSLDYIAGLSDDKGGMHCNYIEPHERKMIDDLRKMNPSDREHLRSEIDYILNRTSS